MIGFPTNSRRLAALNLKRCPLCGTLNARQNAECITCRWHGAFEDDPLSIEEGLMEMIDRCPDLAQVFPPARPFVHRLNPFAWLIRLFSGDFGRKKVDLWA